MIDDTAGEGPPLAGHVPFLLFWVARVLAGMGLQIVAAAVGWHVYDLTHSAMALGLVGLAQFAPMVLLTLPAGQAADRFDRRYVVAVSQTCAGLAALVLTLGSLEGWLTTGWIYAAVMVVGGARAFLNPAMAALLPGLVTTEQFPRASALSSSANQAATIAGPAAGGVLFAFGAGVPYALTAFCFLTAALLMLAIRPLRRLEGVKGARLADLFGGIAFIRRQKIVLGSISLDLFAVLLGGATALLPIYADQVLHAGVLGLGFLRAAPAVGAIAMATCLGFRPLRARVGRTMFAAVIAFGLATIVFGLSRDLVLSLVALMVMGAADNVSVVVRSSLVQLATPEALRGRVSAVNFLFVGTSNQLGEFESGLLADLIGAVPAVVLGGIGTIAVALFWIRLFPGLARLESFAEAARLGDSQPIG
ncbi:Transmembrane secretion effector [Arboricoccus pini]|uniref:Transmembrane secretion effector n=1 Tax=Arboricoccus pini TaxID=1963835 RepID=A0A212RRS5_9PROT|nr:MFS transporter [Arboricoccus pini]SNB75198.1 Transmembrane secretion effector [Arboricoccus pini]